MCFATSQQLESVSINRGFDALLGPLVTCHDLAALDPVASAAVTTQALALHDQFFMMFKSKIKLVALGGLVLSFLSLLVHMFLANTSAELVQYNVMTGFVEDLNIKVVGKQGASRKLWKKVKPLEALQPYANPRNKYSVPVHQNNGFIHAKIFGGFEKIRSSICDLVTISRLLNATLVIPELQESANSKGIGSEFKSFSYLYNEDHFIVSLQSDVIIVKDLPPKLKQARKRKECPIFKPEKSASPEYYIEEVLPKLKKGKIIGLVVVNGGCLQSILPSKLVEYQRLRCRVAFHALHFRPEIIALAHQMLKRLQASGQPYLAYHSGLVRDTLAYQGCAELFQDVHTELVQYRRAQMIKQKLVNDELSVDSFIRKANGLCPLMPEEVGLLLRAMGYPPTTRIYLAVEADAFFPGFSNDGTGWPDFSSLVMGHRLYEMASSPTYRPDRKFLANLFNITRDDLYFPKRNWTLAARQHLNNSLGEEGLDRQFLESKPISFLSHPIPECICTISKPIGQECPKWMKDSSLRSKIEESNENEETDDEMDEGQLGNSEDEGRSKTEVFERDSEMDPND
ncbi:hypothetical protein L6452_15879 [Arctium lappa]|uniref:Uncharacterized protein n=1 Tax=Arctium lappa TaxID=4217 RepID=A0ACB9CQ33_ARCLA|nr:hypothetical protein L6452_15879 [Arctium lappa]